mmetsp:Transcript_6729/g.14627  ORF Transcript_6729/g.14627 Transcript_6729/m.14627 type:complete len:201 (+) Transcript_6729:1189-1791(+)
MKNGQLRRTQRCLIKMTYQTSPWTMAHPRTRPARLCGRGAVPKRRLAGSTLMCSTTSSRRSGRTNRQDRRANRRLANSGKRWDRPHGEISQRAAHGRATRPWSSGSARHGKWRGERPSDWEAGSGGLAGRAPGSSKRARTWPPHTCRSSSSWPGRTPGERSGSDAGTSSGRCRNAATTTSLKNLHYRASRASATYIHRTA